MKGNRFETSGKGPPREVTACIIRRWLAGDREAGAEFERAFRFLVFRWTKAFGPLVPWADPLDLQQEVWVAFGKAARYWNPEVSEFSTFAHYVARRHVQRAFCRRVRLETNVDAGVDEEDVANWQQCLEDQEECRALLARAGLDHLRPAERTILLRCCVDGETLQAVGRDLGLSRERIRQIKESTLDKMRRRLGVEVARA